VLSKALWPPHRDSYMRTTEGPRNAERAQRESCAKEVRECAAKGIIEDGARSPGLMS
jgi:hypothetical protein